MSNLPRYKIIKYIRDNNRNPRGVIVACWGENNKYVVGWSLCRKGDTFKKRLALDIAFGRAVAENTDMPNSLPQPIASEYCAFQDRAVRYFAQPQ